MGTDEAVASQFGLLGALVWAASQSSKNSSDYTVDTEGVSLHQKSLTVLKERLGASASIRFADFTSDSEIDPVALSRQIRDIRLFGSNAPTAGEITAYSSKHGVDYVLYSVHWGGVYENNKHLFLASKWRLYDAAGNEAVSVLTRSVDDKTVASTLEPATLTDKLFELFKENLDRFLDAVTKARP